MGVWVANWKQVFFKLKYIDWMHFWAKNIQGARNWDLKTKKNEKETHTQKSREEERERVKHQVLINKLELHKHILYNIIYLKQKKRIWKTWRR